jgi:hypothetical protein
MEKRGVIGFFDRLEDKFRARLSHRPILYAFIGGVGVVLFWKGVWEAAEFFPTLYGLPSAILGLLLILPTGLFVSFFIGDNIILSGYRQQKKLAEKTEDEIKKDIDREIVIKAQLDRLERELNQMRMQLTIALAATSASAVASTPTVAESPKPKPKPKPKKRKKRVMDEIKENPSE